MSKLDHGRISDLFAEATMLFENAASLASEGQAQSLSRDQYRDLLSHLSQSEQQLTQILELLRTGLK